MEERVTDEPWYPDDMVREYRLVSFVGRGGFGEVWRAEDTILAARPVAIKVLLTQIDATEDERRQDEERFLLEAQETSRLFGGPHIIPILAWGRYKGRPYFAMPYIAGDHLGRLLDAGPLVPTRAVEIVRQVTEALEHAHDEGRVHRDVKPSNILVTTSSTSRDYVHLVDFGILGLIDQGSGQRRTRTGVVVGSMHYMAPERIPTGRHPDAPAPEPSQDVYGLACVLFECLTGRRAFTGGNDLALALAHTSLGRPRPSMHDPDLGAFDEVVVRGLAVRGPGKGYGDRTATVVEFRAQMEAALQQWRENASGPNRPGTWYPSPGVPDPRPTRRPDPPVVSGGAPPTRGLITPPPDSPRTPEPVGPATSVPGPTPEVPGTPAGVVHGPASPGTVAPPTSGPGAGLADPAGAEAPAAGLAVSGSPSVEPADVGQPVPGQPGPELPRADQAVSDHPVVDQPGVDQPEVDQPEVDQPEVDQPEVDQPEVDQPRSDEPDAPRPTPEPSGVQEPGGQEPGGQEPGGDELEAGPGAPDDRRSVQPGSDRSDGLGRWRVTTSPPALGAVTGTAGALVGLASGLDLVTMAVVIAATYGGGASFAVWRRRGD